MKVKIVQSESPEYWYAGMIGDVVDVESSPEYAGMWYRMDGEYGHGARLLRVNDVVQVAEQPARNKYSREIKPGIFVDVYDVLRAFNVTDPCLQHLLKKALAGGQRGHKSLGEDLRDILASAKRAVEMHEEWNAAE